MSYEGRVQLICSNGHYEVRDCNDESEHCSTCSAHYAWHNGIDDTNGNAEGEVPLSVLNERFLISEPKLSTCLTCNHTSIGERAKYRPPREEEMAGIRHWTNWETGKLELLKRDK